MHRFVMRLLALLPFLSGCIPGLVAEQVDEEYGLINGRFACQIEGEDINDDVELGESIGSEWGLEDCVNEQFHLEGTQSGSTCVDVVAVMVRNNTIRECTQTN